MGRSRVRRIPGIESCFWLRGPCEMKTEETPPTIAALAALSGQGPQLQVPSLVLLKAGTKSPSIFIAHGMGDTVMGLVQLASHLQVLHPIYGMQARGLDGLDDPLDRIED